MKAHRADRPHFEPFFVVSHGKRAHDDTFHSQLDWKLARPRFLASPAASIIDKRVWVRALTGVRGRHKRPKHLTFVEIEQ